MPDRHVAYLRELHDRHAPELWRYAMRLTGDRHLSEDVVQEALLRAWRRPDHFAGDASWRRAWLFTVVRNLVIDDRRRPATTREVVRALPPDPPSPDQAEAVVEAELVGRALARLSTDHRTVIVQAYYGRRSIDDIASDLHLPAGTVKSRLHYALRALRKELADVGAVER